MIGHLSSNKLVNTVGTTQSVLLNHISDMREYLDSSLRVRNLFYYLDGGRYV